ncbi:hypothetical protein WJX75_001144 [Coccomyxa subellipsoidea]|uniref:Protein kinase domain-containing protein n=1 Tax=Coccomyxa subellipsoidea TaxID=248742 RepID=A0ABR2Z2P4_9CHLO
MATAVSEGGQHRPAGGEKQAQQPTKQQKSSRRSDAGKPLGNYLAGIKHYVQIGCLGHGTFGIVIKALDLRSDPPTEVAIKLLPRGDFVKNYQLYVRREIQNQSSLRHPLIVSLREVFLTPTHLAIAMEYAQGGDLFNYTLGHRPHGRLAEQQARWIFQQLIIGLDYSHRRGVANRDLKLENLLLDRDGRDGTRPLLKICDFGYSKHEQNSSAKTGVGTPVYMAPEVILGESKYDAKKADIWSCGVILYAMLYGKYPFDAKEARFARKIVTADYKLLPEVEVSMDCLDILTRVLVASPGDRMSMDEIKTHAWFLKGLPPGALEMNDFLLQGLANQEEYHTKIDAIVDQAQHPGSSAEGAWFCTL